MYKNGFFKDTVTDNPYENRTKTISAYKAITPNTTYTK